MAADPYFEAHSPLPAQRNNSTAFEAKFASNPRRRGTVQAAEGLAQRIPAIEDNFTDAFQSARAQQPGGQFIEVRRAVGRSAVADGSNLAQPTWTSANVERSTPDFLGSALANGELHKLNPNIPALSERSSSQTHVRLDLLNLTERPRTSYGYSMGSNDKQQLRRHNEAETID